MLVCHLHALLDSSLLLGPHYAQLVLLEPTVLTLIMVFIPSGLVYVLLACTQVEKLQPVMSAQQVANALCLLEVYLLQV